MSNELITSGNEDEGKDLIVPDFLKTTDGELIVGTDQLQKYMRLRYAKIVQNNSHKLKEEGFDEGDIITQPGHTLIGKKDQILHFVPVFFYAEYTIHQAFGSKEFIKEDDKSFDPESEIGRRARMRKLKDREFPSTEVTGKMCEYCEHLNFVVFFLDVEELVKTPIVLSLFKGEYVSGTNLSGLVDARQVKHIAGNRMQLSIGQHSGKGNKWYGYNFSNPTDGKKWVTNKNQFDFYCQWHEDIRASFDEGTLQVDYESESGEDAADDEKY